MGASANPVARTVVVIFILTIAVVLSGCGLGAASTSEVTPPTTDPNDVSTSTSNIDFGTVPIKTTSKVSFQIKNTTTQDITVQKVDITGNSFSVTDVTVPLTISAGATYTAYATFSPTSEGTTSGTAIITTNKSNGNGKKIGLVGSGGTSKVEVNPASVSFGTVAVGKTTSQTVAVTNPGTVAVKISAASVSSSAFAISDSTWVYPVTIAAGGSKNLAVSYAPKAVGSNTATVSFTSDATSGSSTLSLAGSAANGGVLSVSPASMEFGNIVAGTVANQTATLSNTGTAPLVISAISDNNAAFSITGVTLPLTLNAGASVPANVRFAPTTGGAVTASFSFTNDGLTSPVGFVASGNGLTPTLTPTPSSIAFGNVNIGTTATDSLALQNATAASITISQMTVSGTEFGLQGFTLPLTIGPGQTVTGTVRYTPGAAGADTGSISITSNASPVTIALSGTGVTNPDATISPSSVSFGNVNTGTTATRTVTVQNTGTANLSVSAISVTGAGFSVSGFTLPMTLAPGQSASGTVAFAPTSTGAVAASLTVTSNSNPVSAPLSGTGVQPALAITPTSIAFGNVNVGSSTTQNLTLRNSGTANLSISAITASGSGYSVSGFALPAVVTPGQSIAGSVTFTPATATAMTGSVTITSNAANAYSPVSLTGTGVAATPAATLSPNSFTFGNVSVGSSATQAITIRNSGNADLTVTQFTATNAAFSVTGFTLPLTLAAGQSASGSVRFAPTNAGAVSGNVSVLSNASTASATVSGTGVQPQLTMSPTSVAFGNVTTGNTSTQAVTLSNSGTASLTVSGLIVSGTGFSVTGFTFPLTIAAGASATGSVRFTPTATGPASGSVTANSNSATAVAPVALSGTGVAATPQIAVSPTAINFGSVTVGASNSNPLTISNTGSADLTVTAITPTGAGYTVNAFILPLTLAPGASAVGNVVFAPATTGTLNGSVSIASNSGTAAPTISLTGFGAAAPTYLLSASPNSLSFGNVVVGLSSTLTVTLTNTGNSTLSVTAANVTGTGYSVSGITLPASIAAGASRTVNVMFAPQISGAANGTVSFVSNATNSPASITMSGTGQAPVQHSVDLTWVASTSTSAVGYRVYRSSTAGGPYTLLSTGTVSGTTYTDGTVTSGLTYYYVVRTIDSAGNESTNSNEASAVIPIP